MTFDAMRAVLKAREPSSIVPLEQILVDLGVHDGMQIPAGDVGSVVPRVQAKLDAAVANKEVDFTDPAVNVDQKLVDGRVVVTLRISAKRT